MLLYLSQFGSSSNNTQSKPSSIDPAPTQCVNINPTSPHQHNIQLQLSTSTTSAAQNLKPSDNQQKPADYSSSTTPPLGNSHHHDRARDHAMPVWIYGLIDSQLKYSNAASSSKPSTTSNIPSSSVVPDHLELTLAAPVRPINLEQHRSSSSSSSPTGGPLLNIGPISVT